MDTSFAIQAAAMKQAQIQTTAQFAILKKQSEMDMMLVEMIDSVAQSAPVPDGQGLVLDKTA